jgi:hypothetical protein
VYASLTGVCSSPVGSPCLVNNDPYNQLAAYYRQQPIHLGTCSATSSWSGSAGVAQLHCTGQQTTVAIPITSASLLLPRFSRLYNVRSSMVSIATRRALTTHAYVAIDVTNHDIAYELPCVARVMHCSDELVVFSSNVRHVVPPNTTHTFRFTIFHTRSMLNVSSLSCEVSVESYGISIANEAVVCSMDDDSVAKGRNNNGTVVARAMGLLTWGCTIDQTGPSCAPVDCFVKYAGTKNYYNSTFGLCVVLVTCPKSQYYDPLTNTCVDPNNVDATISNNIPAGYVDPSPIFINDFSQVANYTNATQAPQIVHVNSSSTATSSSAPSMSVVGIVMVVVIVLVSICVVCCIGKCVCVARRRHRKRKARKAEQESMSSQLFQSWSIMGSTHTPPASSTSQVVENAYNFKLPASLSGSPTAAQPYSTSPQHQNGLLGLM